MHKGICLASPENPKCQIDQQYHGNTTFEKRGAVCPSILVCEFYHSPLWGTAGGGSLYFLSQSRRTFVDIKSHCSNGMMASPLVLIIFSPFPPLSCTFVGSSKVIGQRKIPSPCK